MPFPWHDWQFWVVTALFVAAAWYLLRGIIPIPILSRRAQAKRTEHKATLTISAKREPPSTPPSSAAPMPPADTKQ